MSTDARQADAGPPQVSVVMPVYNGEKFLREAIESVCAQTHRDLELIVVDDGSTDGTADILDDAATRDGRVRVIRNDQNVGVTASLNRAFRAARGQYVARQDADDISVPDRLEKQVAFMESHPDVGVCGTSTENINATRSRLRHYPADHGAARCELLFRCPFAHPSVMLRKDLFARHGLEYDESYPCAQDYALWADAAPHVGFANIPEVLVRRRVHSASISSQHREAQRAGARRVRRRLLDELGVDSSEEELSLHTEIGDREFCSSRELTRRAEAWLRKLQAANTAAKKYPEPAFSRLLADEWFYVCDRHSYQGVRAAGWAMRCFFASPLFRKRRKKLRTTFKTVCWLAHGPLGRRIRRRRAAPGMGFPKNHQSGQES